MKRGRNSKGILPDGYAPLALDASSAKRSRSPFLEVPLCCSTPFAARVTGKPETINMPYPSQDLGRVFRRNFLESPLPYTHADGLQACGSNLGMCVVGSGPGRPVVTPHAHLKESRPRRANLLKSQDPETVKLYS